MQRLITTKRILVLALLIIIGSSILWLLGNSYIEISVEGSTGDEITYTITKQGDTGEKEIKTTNKKLKTSVSKGGYEVLVRQGSKSSFAVVSTSGFMRTTDTVASLKSEKNRSFVGDNPGSCMYVVAGILTSSLCQDEVENLGFHLPATASQASFVKKAIGPAGTLEDLLPIDDHALALVRTESEIDGEGNIHLLYRVNSSGLFNQTYIRKLGDLNSGKIYQLTRYRDGYLLISDDGSERLHYTSFDTKPEIMNFEKPNDTSLVYKSSSSINETIFSVYSNDSSPHSGHFDGGAYRAHSEEFEDNSPSKFRSVVLVTSGKATGSITVNESVVKAEGCGNGIVCLLTSDSMILVFKKHGDSYREMYRVTGVMDIFRVSKSMYIVKSNGVIELDSNTQKGHIVYSFGEYVYCGTSRNSEQLVVCVADGFGVKRALSLSVKEDDNTNSIDKKILILEKLPQIKHLSVYGNYIHVSPELGELSYQPAINGFGYEPQRIKSASEAINNEVSRLGIDTGKYRIINPFR